MEARLEDVLAHSEFTDFQALYAHAKKGLSTSLKQYLIDRATNNETLFFRDTNAFKSLKELFERHLQLDFLEPIKIWSAASSTGQEALSLAITLEQLKKSVDYKIWASDILTTPIPESETSVSLST